MKMEIKFLDFERLKEGILRCNDCETKFGFKPIPIIHGNKYSKIFQISQAPSKNVHLTKKPFNDSTGKKLKYKWYQISDDIFYSKDNFYISALSHCFPGKNSKGGDNLPPISCAKQWLKKEIEIVKNELFIIIGGKAANFLFPNEDYNKLIFKNNTLNDILTIVLPHPSPLNIRWYKEHPEFEKERLPEIRQIIWNVLKIENAYISN
jgi:uracil-DNA glycosylase family 4